MILCRFMKHVTDQNWFAVGMEVFVAPTEIIKKTDPKRIGFFKWCPGADLNHRHADFQSAALPLSYPGI